MGKLIVIALAAALAGGSIGAALTSPREAAAGDPILLGSTEGRRDDAELEVQTEESEGDGDDTRGDDGTAGGANTGDGDRTHGDDGTAGGANTADGDATRGNDGTNGGDNTFQAAPAPAPAAVPAPAPVDSYDGGAGGVSQTGGGDT